MMTESPKTDMTTADPAESQPARRPRGRPRSASGKAAREAQATAAQPARRRGRPPKDRQPAGMEQATEQPKRGKRSAPATRAATERPAPIATSILPAAIEKPGQPVAVTAYLPPEEYVQYDRMLLEAGMQGIKRPTGVMIIRAALQAFQALTPEARAKHLRDLNVPRTGRPRTKEKA